ncbi:MAG: hypothetical protein IAF94_26625 [Pirellulaceae bacterium]|nr:hypothetical protein [Pirellulaceae bacterium]
MRSICQYFCVVSLFLVAAASVAQQRNQEKTKEPPPAREGTNAPLDSGFPRPERTFPRPTYRVTESSTTLSRNSGGPLRRHENPPAGRPISVEVVVAETPVSGNGKEMSAEKIAELEKAGKLVSLFRYWVSLVENQPSELHFGERVQVVVGRANLAGGRGMQETSAYENVGTKLRVLGRIEGDSILVQLEMDQTRLVPPPAKAEGEAGETPSRPHTTTTSYQSTLAVPSGNTIVAGGKETQNERGKVQTWLLVSGSADGAKPVADEESITKIFRLINANADSLATILQGIFREDNVQIGVDARTNSLVVRGDAKTHEIVFSIIVALDELGVEKKK